MERRHFLHNLAHVAAAPSIFSSLAFSNEKISDFSSLSNTIAPGNILVLIQLNGGNDGLNTLIPLNMMSPLNKVRPHVVLPDNSIINLDKNDLGLHPSLSGFKSFFDENRLKIVQNVGYPIPNYSHFRSMDIWQSASDASQFLSSGWLGRYIEKNHPAFPENYPNKDYPHPLSLEIGWSSSLLFTGEKSFTSVVANNPNDFYKIINDFDNVYPSSNSGEKLKYLQLMGKQSNEYGQVLKNCYEAGDIKEDFPRTNLGRQLEIVTRLISGGINTRIFMVELGGFDTHDEQVEENDHAKGIHNYLLKDLNDSVTAFIKNLDTIGRSDDVLTMTFSEFGRTVHSNGTFGTDHGTVAPVFLIGNKLIPSIEGNNPYIPSDNNNNQYEIDKEFDFRQIYSSVISQWFNEDILVNKHVLLRNFDQIPLIQEMYVDPNIDTDNDGVADINDNCPETPEGSVVDLNGCVLFTLAANNYSVKSVSASCIGSNNGKIEISAEDTSYTYQVNISGIDSTYSLSADNNHSLVIEDLEVGAYTINFTIDSQEGYIQSFETTITEPAPLQGKAQVDYFSKTAKLKLSGSEVYYIEVNGQMMASNSNDFSAPLKPGKNIIKVTTPLDCQGVYEEVLFMSEKLRYFPNPVQNELNITVPGTDSEINIEIFTDGGANLYRGTHSINGSRTIQLPMSRYKSGLYIVTGSGKTVNESFKIIKN